MKSPKNAGNMDYLNIKSKLTAKEEMKNYKMISIISLKFNCPNFRDSSIKTT